MADASTAALPLELWSCIGSQLPNADIKSFRLTCKQFNNMRSSATLLQHNKFRHQVNEIIWDDARLHRGPPRAGEIDEGDELLSDEDEPDNNRDWAAEYYPNYREDIIGRHGFIGRHGYEERDWCPKWFKAGCSEIGFCSNRREDRDVDMSDLITRREQFFAHSSPKEDWQHYQQLLRQQKEVLASQSDLEAFAFGVKQFPALKRVTITPEAHGDVINPLYPTPMIRALPKGFKYPIPRGWLCPADTELPATAYTWNQYPELRDRYRGFRTAMRVLAKEPNSVSELVMTSHSIPTGINCTIFDEPCEEYDHFATVLKKPGFRRLDIALLVSGEPRHDSDACWRSLDNGRFRRAVGEAKDMEEFRLHTTFVEKLYRADGYPLLPLQDIVPVEQWSNLRHFELSGFVLAQG
ncbi:hypothetical protein N7535_006507 [Penicillium sp. DV-2018c]|nr:hypothetical protein N7535_006507 [Penicillium sp. DV-2018c]